MRQPPVHPPRPVEETVLRGLKNNLLQPKLIHEFVTAYQLTSTGARLTR
jgi:hypothetical protein